MNKLIFDTHAHYDSIQFENFRDTFLSNLTQNNVAGIVNVAVDINTSELGIEYSRKYENVYSSIGICPYNTINLNDNCLKILEQLASHKKVVAVGEIGIDYHANTIPRKLQIKHFEEQLDFAQKINLPVIVHSRDAFEDTMYVLKNNKPSKCVIHCFSYDSQIAYQFLVMGFYLSFTGNITFKNSKKFNDIFVVTPCENILIETDCPYMAPEPLRGKLCDSSMLKYTAQKIAEFKNKGTNEMINILNDNASKFYNIKINAEAEEYV